MGLGDDLMVTGEVRDLYAKNQLKVKVMIEKNKIRKSEVFLRNPYMIREGEPSNVSNTQTLGPEAGRRYISKITPDKYIWKDSTPARGQIFFSNRELIAARDIAKSLGSLPVFIEPNLKPRAPINKDWGWASWNNLVNSAPDINWVQIVKDGSKLLPKVQYATTPDFRTAIALLRHAAVSVLPEGGLHHASAVVGSKAIVLFGGFISPKQTGYDDHINIFTGGIPCGNRLPCSHCKKAMQDITPSMVLDHLNGILT
jgi:hypothetical protein